MAIFRMDNQQGPTVWHIELCLMLCGSLDGRGVPGKSHGQRRLAGYSPWGCKELDMTDQLNGRGFGWTLGVGVGQGGMACCGSWGCKESDTTE